MISRADIQRLIQREPDGRPILSAFLDMSVNSDNKRTHAIFLAQQRTRLADEHPDRAEVERAFDRVGRWIDDAFDEENHGAAVYVQLHGDWLEGLQAPAPLPDLVRIDERPVIGPIAQVVASERPCMVVLVDREHLRMMTVHMGRIRDEHEVRTEPYPAPHDVQRGGYSQPGFQRRKAEEVRQFFKEFALEVGEFARRYHDEDDAGLVLLGTEENVKNFLPFLPAAVRDRVVHTAHAPIDADHGELLGRLEPFLERRKREERSAMIDVLEDRVRHRHFAVAGFADTLEQLQEGKVETLVIARDAERQGARCTRCGFLLARAEDRCLYCGGPVRGGIDLAEAMIRAAEDRQVRLAFVDPRTLDGYDGVGALLRF